MEQLTVPWTAGRAVPSASNKRLAAHIARQKGHFDLWLRRAGLYRKIKAFTEARLGRMLSTLLEQWRIWDRALEPTIDNRI